MFASLPISPLVSLPGSKFRRLVPVLILFTFLISVAGADAGGFRPPPPVPDDRRDVPPPVKWDANEVADGFKAQFVYPIKRFLKISRHLRALAGKPKEAMNVNAFDEVDDCSWFVNRNALRRMTLEEIARGPDTGTGPDTSGVWTISRPKTEGVTPGFDIKDKQGVRYVIKFDPKGCDELMSGAEVVSTKLFYAAGYHVPENYITYFHPRIVRMGDDLEFTDSTGRKRPMTEADLKALLSRLDYQPDGRVRAVASKYLPPEPIGNYRYSGTRPDDYNDIIPHQHRRDLRGQRVVSAWLNRCDTKANNTYDSYVTVDGKSYVRHYLLDFGSDLGSAAYGPKPQFMGHENLYDPDDVLVNTLSLGLHVHSYEKEKEIKHTSIGRFTAQGFHPQRYEFNFPIRAFLNLTDRDGYWGAKLVMSFTDEQIRTVVAQGRYSNPEAAAYLARVLIERRDIVGRYWFGKVPPLDRFKLIETARGNLELEFVDLAVDTGLERAEDSRYRYRIKKNGKLIEKWRETGSRTQLSLPRETFSIADPAKEESSAETELEITLQVQRGKSRKWSRSVKVYIRTDTTSGTPVLIGLKR